MAEYATKQDVEEIVSRVVHEVVPKVVREVVNEVVHEVVHEVVYEVVNKVVDEKINKAVDNLSSIITTFMHQVDERTNKAEKRLTTIESSQEKHLTTTYRHESKFPTLEDNMSLYMRKTDKLEKQVRKLSQQQAA